MALLCPLIYRCCPCPSPLILHPTPTLHLDPNPHLARPSGFSCDLTFGTCVPQAASLAAAVLPPHGTPLPLPKQSSKVSSGAVAGVVVGGVCLVALGVAAVMYRHRARRTGPTKDKSVHGPGAVSGPTVALAGSATRPGRVSPDTTLSAATLRVEGITAPNASLPGSAVVSGPTATAGAVDELSASSSDERVGASHRCSPPPPQHLSCTQRLAIPSPPHIAFGFVVHVRRRC